MGSMVWRDLNFGKSYYILIGILCAEFLAILDMWTQVFGGNLLAWVNGILFFGVAGVMVKNYLQSRVDKKIQLGLDEIGYQQRNALRKILSENPLYRTFCHECRHFDPGLASCRFFFGGRRNMVTFPQNRSVRYCLYWNVEIPPHLQRNILPEKRREKENEILG